MSSSRSAGRPAYLPQLDGVRGIGMALVLLAHLPRPADWAAGATVWRAEHALHLGDIALDSFFVMSGFLITRLLLAERVRTGQVDLRAFYLRRVLRIFPAYYIAAAAVTALWPTAPGRTASLLLYAYNFYLPFNPEPYPLEQSWSLAVEEQFYLLWPLLLILAPVRWLRPLTAFVLPGAAVLSAIAFALAAPPALAAELTYMMLPTRMLALSLGCYLAVREQQGAAGLSLRQAAACAGGGIALVAAAAALRSTGLVPAGGWSWAIILPGYSLIGCGVVAALIHPAAPRALLAPFRFAPVRFLGQLSYAVYLIHVPVLFAMGLNAAALDGAPAPTWRIAVAVAVSLAGGVASLYLIERPLARRRHWFTRAAPGTAPSSASVVR